MVDRRWLVWASAVETISLTVLVLNLVTVHHPLVTSTMGPVHGFAYLATIAVVLLLPVGTGTRLPALVPGVGGLLVVRRVRQEPPTAGGTPR